MIYYFFLNTTGQKYEGLTGFSALDIENALSEDFGSDLFSDFCCEVPSHENIEGSSFSEDDIFEVYDIIDKKYTDEQIVVYDNNDNEVARYLLSEVYKHLAENYIGSESGDIEICRIWSSQLQNFIDAGKWFVALQSDNDIKLDPSSWPIPEIDNGHIHWEADGKKYEPIMWFGGINMDKLETWTLTEDGIPALVLEEEGLGSYGGQMRINGFEINYGKLFEGNGFWYFGACGESGANFEKVIESCPINLLSIHKNHNGIEILSLYCLKLQGLQ